jgi:hypothetical protein
MGLLVNSAIKADPGAKIVNGGHYRMGESALVGLEAKLLPLLVAGLAVPGKEIVGGRIALPRVR